MRKALLPILLLSLVAATSLQALSASLAFQDAFRSYVKVRQLEEEKLLLSLRTDLESEDKASKIEKLSSELTAARIDFQSVLQSDGASLAPWERQALEHIGPKAGHKAKTKEPVDPLNMALLQQAFPAAREFSPLEWQVLGDWFGQANQRSFLQATYSMEAAPSGASKVEGKKPELVWVTVTHSALLGRKELGQQRARVDAAQKKLEASGYAVTEIPVSPYSRIEDQAEELHLALAAKAEDGAFFLVSDANASAILLKAFDLNPGLLQQKEILGWVNLNGRLYGSEPEDKGRSPASASKKGPSYQQGNQARLEELRLRHERLSRQAPLGAKFPILNLVAFPEGRPNKPSNLRESLVPEGKTLISPSADAFAGLDSALSLLGH